MTRRKRTKFEQPAPFVQVVRWATKQGQRVGYRARVMHMGKRVPAPVRETVEDAQADVAEIRRKVEFVPADVLTFARAVEQAREAMLGRGVKQGTVDWFDSHRKHAESFFGTQLLHRIGRAQLNEFFAWRRRTSKDGVGNGLQHDRRFLVLVFRNAIKLDALLRDPTDGYDWPTKVDNQPEFFLPGEFTELLRRIRQSGESSAEADAGLVSILANTGMRLSEFGRLRVERVNLADLLLTIDGKRGPRRIELRPELLPHFLRLLAGREQFAHRRTEHVLPPFTDAGIEPTKKKDAAAIAHGRRTEVVTRALERWAFKLDEKRLHAHALRHTCGVALALAGKSIPQIMGLLGNTHRMAEYYANVVAAMQGKGFRGIDLAT